MVVQFDILWQKWKLEVLGYNTISNTNIEMLYIYSWSSSAAMEQLVCNKCGRGVVQNTITSNCTIGRQ